MNEFTDKEQELQKLYKVQKSILYVLLGLIYSAFIGMQLGRIQAIADYSYSLHELLYFPATVAIYLVPVMFLVYLYHLIKYVMKKERKKPRLLSAVKGILVMISVFVIMFIVNYQSHEVSTGGVFVLEQKILDEGKYYLVFEDKKIRVSMNEFQLAEVKKEYAVSFVWNSRSPDKGQLETIEPIKLGE
jgi:hypothetical protein